MPFFGNSFLSMCIYVYMVCILFVLSTRKEFEPSPWTANMFFYSDSTNYHCCFEDIKAYVRLIVVRIPKRMGAFKGAPNSSVSWF